MVKSKSFLLVFLVYLISLLTVGCAETRISQCQKIINISSKISQESKENRNTKDSQQLLKVADGFNRAAEDMEKLEIKDEKLIQYKTQFAQIYRGYARATKTMISAVTNQDIKTAKLTQDKVKELGQEEERLGNEMIIYCQNN
jgi:hypothetical protein